MPLDESKLLAGVRLVTTLKGAQTLADLKKLVAYNLSPQAPDERVAVQTIATALASLNTSVPQALNQIASGFPPQAQIGDRKLYWKDLWFLLLYADAELPRLGADPNVTVNEVHQFIQYLRTGFEPAGGLDVPIPTGGQTQLRHCVRLRGWAEHRPDRPLSIAQVAQIIAAPTDFAKLDEFFSRGQATSKARLIAEKITGANASLVIEDKYWQLIK